MGQHDRDSPHYDYVGQKDKRNCQLSSPGDNEVLPVCIEIKPHCVFTTKVEQTFLRE